MLKPFIHKLSGKKVLSVSTKSIATNPIVKRCFSGYLLVHNKKFLADAFAGWGLKDNTKSVRRYAYNKNLPYYALEDGFLRSVQPGVLGGASHSLIADKQGIYYDCNNKSDLDDLIINSKINRFRCDQLIKNITDFNVSKYNDGRPFSGINKKNKKNILLIDQTHGDQSIICGGAGENDFVRMVKDACMTPDSEIFIKIHPDVLCNKKQGCINLAQLPDKIHIISENYNPISLLKHFDEVYCVTSQMGFEACLLGKEVFCYGRPFYSGWGILHERSETAKPAYRNVKRDIFQIFWASYVEYPKYYDPDADELCEIEKIVEKLTCNKCQTSETTTGT